MLLTLFSALALAFVLSERLSAPLSALGGGDPRDRQGATTRSSIR
jgi:hypothetical protein